MRCAVPLSRPRCAARSERRQPKLTREASSFSSRPEARDALLRLLQDADVLIENFLAGTMEKWGLGYDAVLAPRLPRLVYCRISGFGADGPLGNLPGYDAVLQAMCGLMSVNGDA